MDDFDAQDPHDLLPLGIGLVGLQDVFAPQAIPPLDEAKDAQGVDIVTQGDSIRFQTIRAAWMWYQVVSTGKKSAKRSLRLKSSMEVMRVDFS